MVVELQGCTLSVQTISSQGPLSPLRPCSLRLQDSLDLGLDPLNKHDSMLESIDSDGMFFEFSEVCGKNIQLSDDKKSAFRTKSYNHGIVCVSKPLCKGHSISVSVSSLILRVFISNNRFPTVQSRTNQQQVEGDIHDWRHW